MPFEIPKCDFCRVANSAITCPKCAENYCQGCDLKLHATGKRAQHVRHPSQALPSRYCTVKTHETEVLSLHCEECCKVICALCNIEHKSHELLPVKVAAAKWKIKLEQKLVPLQEKREKI